MLNNFLFHSFNFLLTNIYNRNVKRFGYTPRGLFWNSKDSQFKYLLEGTLDFIDKHSHSMKSTGILNLKNEIKDLFLKKQYEIV